MSAAATPSPQAAPIRVYHRTRRQLETERIYGEAWLRWAYESAPGRLSVELLAKRRLLSWWFGWRMRSRHSARRVFPFIVDYELDVDEFAKSAYDYKSFNDFFTRALKPGARPIAPGDDVAVLPADGRHLVFPDVEAADTFYVKGQRFDLPALLGGEAAAAPWRGGAMVISRLCPVDYHRFHFAVAGQPGEATLLNGFLYSVSPIALRRRLSCLWENKRYLTRHDAPACGPVAIVEVGATNVGSVLQTYLTSRPAQKGEEKGMFRFGGSCVITLFARGRIRLDNDLVAQSAQGIETYARMGERLGELTR